MGGNLGYISVLLPEWHFHCFSNGVFKNAPTHAAIERNPNMTSEATDMDTQSNLEQLHVYTITYKKNHFHVPGCTYL